MRIPELRVTASRRSLALIATALVFTACAAPAARESQAPSDTPAATASASASATAVPTLSATPELSVTPELSATPAPTLAFEPPDDILPPNSIVVTVVDGLQLRDGPGLDADVTGLARTGDQFRVYQFYGPVVRDGLDWYWLFSATAGDLSAWAAAGSGAERYLEVVAPTCPSGDPDLATLIGVAEWDRLACFGDRSLTLEGTFGCGGCGGAWVGAFEPQWLAYPITGHYLNQADFGAALQLRVAPDSGLEVPGEASIVRVTGHFSDPTSTSCRITTGDPMAVDPTVAELYCREQFVVDSFEVLGIDPDFPSS